MNLTALVNVHQEKSANNNLFVVNAIFCVLHNFLLTTAPSFVLTVSCRQSESCYFYQDLLQQLFRMWNMIEKSLQLVVVEKNAKPKANSVFGRRNLNLIIIDSYQAFLDVDIISHIYMNNFNEYNYIILQISDNLLKQHLKQILKYCWSNHIIHCSVQVQNQLGEVYVYTYFPYTANYCGKVVPVIINQYNDSAFVKPELFPNKLRNFYGCPLRAAVWEIPPFVQLSTHGSVTNVSGGIEGKLLQTLASSLNFSIDAKIPPRNEQRGRILGLLTTGALFMLENRSADLSVGSFRPTVERNKVATYTVSYYRTKQVFLAMDSEENLKSWQILSYPFETSTWLLIFSILLMALLKTTLANRMYQRCFKFFLHYEPKSDFLNIFSMFIGIPVCCMPRKCHKRILFINWLFFTFVIRIVYLAQLFHFLRTHDENKVPQSFDKLLEANCTAVMNAATYDMLRDLPIFARMPIIALNTSIETIGFTHVESMQSKQYLVVTLQEYFLLYERLRIEGAASFTVLADVVAFPTAIYLTKHSFLIDQFNEKILLMSVAGLIDKWRRYEFDNGLRKVSIFNVDTIFKIKKLYMMFVVYGVGLLLACSVFILELYSCRVTFLKNIFN